MRRKTPQERVAEYEAKAAKIKRELRGRSPQWKVVRRALVAIDDAMMLMRDSQDEQDAELAAALEAARTEIVGCQMDQVSP